jgi:DNA replication factor GINS
MSLTPAQVDKISEELKSVLRVEVKSKKIKKIESNFYKVIVNALESLNSDAEDHLSNQNITGYIQTKERISEIEKDFKAFFQRRFEKIATYSIYDLETDLMNSLTPEEKEFITRLHNAMQDEYDHLLMKRKEKKPEIQEEHKSELEHAAEEIKPENDERGLEKEEDLYILVRIVGDQPPIAQAEKNYYLHDNDLVYLPKKFAEILVNRNSAVKIDIKN